MSLVMVFGVLQYAFTAQQAPVKAAADITTSNYTTWTAATLAEARDSVNKFLTSFKGTDPDRPYKEETDWQEGSLAALDKVYTASASAGSGVSSELARQQLIQTVHGLEKYDSTDYFGRNLALNDYPDDELTYKLMQVINEEEEGVASFLRESRISIADRGNTMTGGLIYNTGGSLAVNNLYLHARNTLMNFFDRGQGTWGAYSFYGLRSNGLASQIGQPISSLDVPTPTVMMAGISSIALGPGKTTYFNDAMPTAVTMSQQSNPAAYIRWAIEKYSVPILGKGLPEPYIYTTIANKSRPVIVLFTNSEFPSQAAKQDYLASLDEFENGTKVKQWTSVPPLFIQISYKRNNAPAGATYDPMIDEIFTPSRIARGWRHIEVDSTNVNENLTDKLWNALPLIPVTQTPGGTIFQTLPWEATLTTNEFQFVPGTFVAESTSATSMTETELKVSGIADGGRGTFDATAKNNSYSGYKMGDKLPALASSVYTSNGNAKDSNASPNLYVPLSDAAVELYTYSGSGSEDLASSYTLKNTAVSNTYQNYGGTSYSWTSSQLASKKYGTELTLAAAKNALKDAMGDAAFNKLNFTNGDSLNAASLTVKFDASKNVYKLYAKEEPTTSTITIEHWIKDGAKIATSTQDDIKKNGTIGELAKITPTVISGYTYVNSDSDPLSSVTFGNTNKTVKLYYTENPTTSTMKVNYVVAGSNEVIIPAKTISGTTGESPTAEQLNKEAVGAGYTYLMQNPNLPKFGTDAEVTLYYLVLNGKITFEHWDKDANQLISGETSKVVTGQVDTRPTQGDLTPKVITGYTYDSASVDLSTIKYTAADQTVKLFYTRKQGSIKIEYWDSDTNTKIANQSDETKTGPTNTNAGITAKTIAGYTFERSEPTSLSSIVFLDTEQTVKLYYRRTKGTITIEYWDQDTNQKIPGQADESQTGNVNDNVGLTPKTIAGYTYQRSEPSPLSSIVYKETTQVVKLYYTKDATEVTLTIRFVDEGGDDLVASKVKPNQQIGKQINVATEYDDVADVITELSKKYQLDVTSLPPDPYTIPNKDATVTFKFLGVLKLVSAPDLEFGIKDTGIFGAVEATSPTYTTPLVVSDSRTTKTGWTLSAKVTKELTALNDSSMVLTDALYYKTDTQEKPMGLNLAKSIYSPGSLNQDSYDISQLEWKNKTNGFIVRLPKTQYRSLDDYQAVIEYSLAETR
ncbi:hypothetical protein RV18_GL001363 [Enterococcus termitis]|nr:hypothetical protein RV18_GL001363 [Enterococcus termitis]